MATFRTPEAALQAQLAQERLIRDVVIPAAQLESANRTMQLVVKDSPVDRGEYKLGWAVMKLVDEVRLVNDAPHAGIIELGARPFRPPFEPIFEWAKRKAGDLAMAGLVKIGSQAFRKTKSGDLRYRGQASLDQDDEEAVRQFAWAVVRKIEREGLPPRYVMKKRLDDALRFLDKAFVKHLRRVARGEGTP